MFSNIFKDKERRVWSLSLLAVAAITGIVASFVLSTEAIELAKNANASLPCSVNAVVDCAAVGSHPTASIFGFPNAFVGLLTLPVMLTIAVAALMGTKFPRPFMFMAELGALAGVVFAAWMLYVSFHVIQVLCPWCLTTDVAMIVLFFALTRYNIQENNLYLPKTTNERAQKFVKQGFDILLALLVFVAMAAALILKFGSALFA